MRDRPTVCIPDDHAAGHMNPWGESGRISGIEGDADGGFRYPVAYVNQVQRQPLRHLPGLEVLGARREEFLREWSQDYAGAEKKCELSATAFRGADHMHGGRDQRLLADLNRNGWPSPRARQSAPADRRS